MNLKVCGFIHQFYPYLGGAEIEAYNTYRFMTRNHPCTVNVITSREKGTGSEEKLGKNYTAKYLPLTPQSLRLYSYPVISHLYTRFMKTEYDIYHGWFGTPGGFIATNRSK